MSLVYWALVVGGLFFGGLLIACIATGVMEGTDDFFGALGSGAAIGLGCLILNDSSRQR